jgi:uncharacterized membrane protein
MKLGNKMREYFLNMKKNRFIIYVLYLLAFCGSAMFINVLFSIIRSDEISIDSVYFAGFYGFIAWVIYLISGELK